MKIKHYILLLLGFYSCDLFGIGGELYIEIKEGTQTCSTYTLAVNMEGYSWDYDTVSNRVVLDIQNYPLVYENYTTQSGNTIKLDAPTDKNSGNNYVGWGIVNLVFSWEDSNGPRYKTVKLDLRDYNWAFYGPYSAHDTHLYLDLITGIMYYKVSVATGFLTLPGSPAKIWEMWFADPDYSPAQGFFDYPVTLKNKIENKEHYFGYLKHYSQNINSGENSLFNSNSTNTISHGTLEEQYDNDRNYSFIWEYSSPYVSHVPDENLYFSNFKFTVSDEEIEKEITRVFKPVHPLTIKNILSENGNISAGEIEFKDPTTDNLFHAYSASGNGFVKNEAFDSLNIEISGQINQKYSIKAKPDFSYDGRRYYWYDGDFDPNSNTDLLITGQTNLNAYYKGPQLSDNSNAYASSSQRKFVNDQGGDCLVSVYESLGKIWLEASYDNGDNWQILNNGKPLNGNTTASNPSINKAEDNIVAVVYQEYKDIRINIVSINLPETNPILYNNVVSTMPDGIFNGKPVVEMQDNYNNNSKLYLIVWDQDYLNAFSNPGLHYRCLERNSTGNYNFINNATKISNTDANSTNPTLAAKYNHTYLHIAWEQEVSSGFYDKEIRYYKINWSSQNVLTFSHYYVPSAGGVFFKNYSPTMTVVDNGGLYITWVGIDDNEQINQVVFRCRHTSDWWYSTFYKYGERVENVSINSAEYPNQYYYGLAWVENGSTNYYKASGISGIQTLNTTGNYVQLANGLGSVNNMQAMTFKNTSIPYAFTVSEKFGTGLNKSNSTQDFEGREGIVSYPSKDKSELERYYYTISDVIVDGNPIKFNELAENVRINNINDLNNYLTTESFTITNGSEITYNTSFGLLIRDTEPKQIKNGKKVKFSVELIDAESGKILGNYDEVDFSKEPYNYKNKNTYKVKPNMKKNNEVKLRLFVEDNDEGEYIIGSIMSKSNVLTKEGAIEIITEGNLIVSDYKLAQNYPNPFNPQTTINYQLPKEGLVTLKVYDALGKEVTELVNGYKSAGSYDVVFDGSNLASGIYFYKLSSGDFIDTKKLILMK